MRLKWVHIQANFASTFSFFNVFLIFLLTTLHIVKDEKTEYF